MRKLTRNEIRTRDEAEKARKKKERLKAKGETPAANNKGSGKK